MAADWKGRDDDGRVRFGTRARLWLERRMRQELERYNNGTAPTKRYGVLPITQDDVVGLVPWFMEDATHYVEWIFYDDYAGARYTRGAWRFNAETVKRDIPQGMEALRDRAAHTADAKAVATLDDWLRADMAGTLQHAGWLGGAEDMRLTPAERADLSDKAFARRYNWPKACATCGESFRGGEYKNCKACRAKRRKGKGVMDTLPVATPDDPHAAALREAAALLSELSRRTGDLIQQIEGR